MNIRELEEKIKEIFDVNTDVRFHPQHNWCLEVRTGKSYLFSDQTEKLSELSKKYGLDIHTSDDGFIFKKLRLYITEKYKDK